MDVLVSLDGMNWTSVSSSIGNAVDLEGDEAHGNASFRKGFDLGSLTQVRYIRIDGAGSGGAGTNTGDDRFWFSKKITDTHGH